MNYPTPSLAQKAKMSLEQFEDFLLNVCLVDYAKINEAMKSLKKLMDKTDRVRITKPQIRFNIFNSRTSSDLVQGTVIFQMVKYLLHLY